MRASLIAALAIACTSSGQLGGGKAADTAGATATSSETSSTTPTGTSGTSTTATTSTSSTSSTTTDIAAPSHLGLVLSEIMPKNRGGLRDEDGHESDWIELANLGATPLDLAGVTLGDSGSPWTFPARILEPGEHLVVFASRKDRVGAELHTDFSLASDGEDLVLADVDGTVLDRFDPYPATETGVTYGRAGATLALAAGGYRWRIPDGVSADWTAADYDDTAWPEGEGGLGQAGDGGGGPLAHLVSDLAAHWSFDSIEGGRVPDATGRHPGILEEGALLTAGSAGWSGEALSGLTGGWLAASDPELLDFDGDHTWSVWFRGTDDSGCLISRNPDGTDWNQGSKALFVRGGTLQYDAGWVGNPGTGVSVTDDLWHHAAVTFRASDDTFQVYVDGVVRYADRFDANAFPEDTDHNGGRAETGLFVGQADFSGGLSDLGKYDGRIDEVALFSAALSEEDVGALASGAVPSGVPFAGSIGTPVPEGTTRAQLRVPFEVDDPAALDALSVSIRHDDAVLVWLDGLLVAALDAAEGDTVAAADRDDTLALTPTAVALPLEFVRPGRNVLAVEVLAADAESPTLFADVAITASTGLRGHLAEPTPGAPNGLLMSEAVTIAEPSGTFEEEQLVSIEGDGVIRYTLDGSEPTESSPLYDGPLRLDRTRELRARAWQVGKGAGPVAQAVYVETQPALRARERDLPVAVVVASDIGWSWTSAPFLTWEAGSLDERPDYAGPSGVHLRGQSSSGQDKQPYRLELRDPRGHDVDHPLLGLPAEADWVLHAPYVDKSLVRNALVFELGRELGLAAPRTAHVHVYRVEPGAQLTEEAYRGVYVLMETVEIHPDRLDLAELEPHDDEGAVLSGGYLLKFEADVAESPILEGWRTLELHEPDPVTDVQLDWVTDDIAALDEVLFRPDFADPATGYPAWIDVASWVDHLLINELFRDQDAYVRSAYFHKDRDGLYVMGPLWDYNLVAGTGGYFENTEIVGWQWQHPYNVGEHGWHARLMEDPAFAAEVVERWRSLRAGTLSDDSLVDRIATYGVLLEAGADENFARWDNLDEPVVNGFVSPATDSWDAQLDVLAAWLLERAAWMDAELR